MKLFIEKTPIGKPKLVDSYGRTVASAMSVTQLDEANISRIYFCCKALEDFSFEAIQEVVNSDKLEFKICDK